MNLYSRVHLLKLLHIKHLLLYAIFVSNYNGYTHNNTLLVKMTCLYTCEHIKYVRINRQIN